jgi:hypothetical protein
MRRSILAVVALAALTSACGSTPTGPTTITPPPPPPVANVAGNWSGTWEDRYGVSAFRMNLNQSGSTVTGTWEVEGLTGSISGSADSSSFTGSFTLNVGLCTETAAFSGPASAGMVTLNWSSVGLVGNCLNTGRINIVVQRR